MEHLNILYVSQPSQHQNLKPELSGAPFGSDSDQVPEEANEDVSPGHCPHCGETPVRESIAKEAFVSQGSRKKLGKSFFK